MEGDSKKLEKEMSGKGKPEAFPKAKGPKLDSQADVSKKDAAVYKNVKGE